ncbi:MAG TPA: hypothetical protein PLL33_09995 [Paracoccus sp. (in: a-proteobacteria)]|nr:hypothetical protein [Paracoccus sp. (in: a-proteobacteria)]
MRLFLLIAALAAPVPGLAATPTPDWPCVQPRQPHLSLGQVWAGPPPDADTPRLAADPAIAALADRAVQRRLPVEEAEAAIADFAAGASDAQLTALMQAVFDRIDSHRTRLLDGIARYGRKQVDLAAQVESRRQRMAELEKAPWPDFDAIDREEAALDMETRVFTDRQQSLTYVCETPVILEQRLFALGRAIAGHLGTQ